MTKPISEWTTAELREYQQHGSRYKGLPTAALAAEVLRLRAVVEHMLAHDAGPLVVELEERAEKAEADLAAWKAEHIPVEPLRWYTEWKRAEADLAAARARLDDYEHMPCEECLTYAPGAEFAHLKAEKDAYMDRAFKAEAELAAARAELGHERELSKERYDEIGDLEVRLEAQEPVVDALWGLVERTRDAIAADPSGHPGTVPFGELVRVVDAYRQVQRETPVWTGNGCPECGSETACACVQRETDAGPFCCSTGPWVHTPECPNAEVQRETPYE